MEELKTALLKSGDRDNGGFISYLNDNREYAEKMINFYQVYDIEDWKPSIFYARYDSKYLKDLTIFLTLYPEIQFRKGANPKALFNINKYFFAILVNGMYWSGKSEVHINCDSALNAAVENLQSIGKDLDYREYVLNFVSADLKWEGLYKSIVINDVKKLGSTTGIQLDLPIHKLKLGRFMFATDGISARMRLLTDTDGVSMTVPKNVWMSFIEEAICRRPTVKFLNAEERFLANYIDYELLAEDMAFLLIVNNFNRVNSFMTMDINGEMELDYGQIRIWTNEPPELSRGNNSVFWVQDRPNLFRLNATSYYVGLERNSGINIFQR